MFVITNRKILKNKTGLKQFGSSPNENGPNELRIAEVEKKRSEWNIEILPDFMDRKRKSSVGFDPEISLLASQYVARKIFQRLQKEKKNLLFFVHGYNNDIKAVLERSFDFEKKYGVIALPFSWPSNGGGIKGLPSYLSDKADTRLSIKALDRCFEKINHYLHLLLGEREKQFCDIAETRFPLNSEKRNKLIFKDREKECPFKVSLILHSMGNYLLKNLLSSSIYHRDLLLFDNIILASADTNNENHSEWVDKIQFRKRLYITINENDAALCASRMKWGATQKARLGHHLFNLNSKQATYVDFSNASRIGNSHAYFFGSSLKNKDVKNFFQKAFNGESAEDNLLYNSSRNIYQFPL